jgi:hypothetical protein
MVDLPQLPNDMVGLKGGDDMASEKITVDFLDASDSSCPVPADAPTA